MRSVKTIIPGVATAVTLALLHTTTSVAQMDSVRSGIQAAHGADQPSDLFGNGGIFTTAVNLMLFIIGAVAVIMIIYGGFRYIISGGNSSNVTTAKNTILYAIIGVVVAILAYAIINFVVTNFESGGTAGL